jgi:hypothetical protein
VRPVGPVPLQATCSHTDCTNEGEPACPIHLDRTTTPNDQHFLWRWHHREQTDLQPTSRKQRDSSIRALGVRAAFKGLSRPRNSRPLTVAGQRPAVPPIRSGALIPVWPLIIFTLPKDTQHACLTGAS